MTSLYEADFYAWANEQALLLRAGKLSAADILNIAEEIESMGKSEKRELVTRLTILLLHLLKWRFQPGLRGNSWRYSIKVQRRDLIPTDGTFDRHTGGRTTSWCAEARHPRLCIIAKVVDGRPPPTMTVVGGGESMVRSVSITRRLADNSSLNAQLSALLADSYISAVLSAAGETGLPETTFPDICPWSYQQVADPDFWPDAAG